jgi:hypothetical protein
MTMRRTVYLAVLSSLVLAVAAMLSAGSSRNSALAEGGCSNHSLHGPYGFAAEGQAFTPGGAESADFASAGQVVFDGQGGLTGKEWESINGGISPTSPAISFSGSYTVTSDCLGTATIAGQRARLMLVERGQEVDIIGTDPGVTAAGQITKQQIGHCSIATLHGVYGFAASGSIGGAQSEAGDLAVLGRLVFDGRGTSTEESSASVNGQQLEATATGPYTVSSDDCTGTDTLTILSGPRTGQVDHVNFVIVEGGSEIKFIVTNSGFVFSGTVDKQPIGVD